MKDSTQFLCLGFRQTNRYSQTTGPETMVIHLQSQKRAWLKFNPTPGSPYDCLACIVRLKSHLAPVRKPMNLFMPFHCSELPKVNAMESIAAKQMLLNLNVQCRRYRKTREWIAGKFSNR